MTAKPTPPPRPLTPAEAPDPSDVYERAHPEHEAGMGRLDNNEATPTQVEDCLEKSVHHRQKNRQLNAQDVVNQTGGHAPSETEHPKYIDKSQNDKTPDGAKPPRKK